MPTYATAADVYRQSGVDSTVISTADVEFFIEDSERWIDEYLGTTFKTGGRTITETLDGTGTRVMFLSWGGRFWSDAEPVLTLNTLSIDGTSVTPANVFIYPHLSKLILKDTAEMTVFSRTKPQQIVVNYTYGHTAVPRIIKQLAAMIAAQHALIKQIGGTYDDVTSYSLPEFTVSKGEPYTNIRETVAKLKEQIESLLKSVRPVTYVG